MSKIFNFTHVLNATTGQRYYIDKAELENDEGFDSTPNGANQYSIDLQPEAPEDSPIQNLTLIVGNTGCWVQISKNLNPHSEHKEGNRMIVDMAEALIEGKTLIIAERN